jgi:hypothetical protein
MRDNIVLAAAVFGIALVLSCMILVLGIGRSMENAGARIAEAVARHGELTHQAGLEVGPSIQSGLDGLNLTVREHARAVQSAGQSIARPSVTMRGPVPIVGHEPLRIRGPGADPALPVDVELGQD